MVKCRFIHIYNNDKLENNRNMYHQNQQSQANKHYGSKSIEDNKIPFLEKEIKEIKKLLIQKFQENRVNMNQLKNQKKNQQFNAPFETISSKVTPIIHDQNTTEYPNQLQQIVPTTQQVIPLTHHQNQMFYQNHPIFAH